MRRKGLIKELNNFFNLSKLTSCMTLALENITILDLSRMLPGPYCTMILSDLGADVIRVENPSDPMSNLPPFFQKGTRVPLMQFL